MIHIKKIYIVLVFLILISCNRFKQINYINIKNQLFNTTTCKLSYLSDSISYIILETNNNCLLPANSSILHIDEKDVFIRGGNYLYRFDREGLYKNKIGKVGGGPEEYYQLYDAGIDSAKNFVLMLAPPNNVYLYDYEGIFIKKIKLNNNTQTVSYIKNNTFACIINEDNDVYSTFFNIYDYDGNLIQQLTLENDSYKFTKSMMSVPIIYKTEDHINVKFVYNDTIFKLSNDKIYISHVLNTGKYCPNREIIENMNKKEDLMANYLQIVDIVETKKYIFVLSIWQRKVFGIVYNKITNEFIHSNYIENPKHGGGIENDLTNFGKFWPMKAIGGKEIVHLIYPHDAGMTDIDAEANPIVQIIHLK